MINCKYCMYYILRDHQHSDIILHVHRACCRTIKKGNHPESSRVYCDLVYTLYGLKMHDVPLIYLVKVSYPCVLVV